ncbi:PH domain-containing protein [Salibacterium sp. K-3]
MDSSLQKPERRLSKKAVRVWVITSIIEEFIFFVILGVLYYLDQRFSWPEWAGWVITGLLIIAVLGAVWSLFISPWLTYRHWRYDVNDEFLQLKRGALKEVLHVVPMTKIQSIATKQGPFLRKYGLLTLTIKTLNSEHEIPALPEDTALETRNLIARYAKIKEVEE